MYPHGHLKSKFFIKTFFMDIKTMADSLAWMMFLVSVHWVCLRCALEGLWQAEGRESIVPA